jgi:hypothetical protein
VSNMAHDRRSVANLWPIDMGEALGRVDP